jgi:hypothetical protein
MTPLAWAVIYGAWWALMWAERQAKEANIEFRAEDASWTGYMAFVCYTFFIVFWQLLYWGGWFILYWVWNR